MNKLNLVLILSSMLLTSNFSSAQDAADIQANQVISPASMGLPRLPKPKDCLFAGTFKQTKTLVGLSVPVNSSGDFLHHCEHGIIWKTSAPIVDTLVITNAQQAYQVRDGKPKKMASRAAKMITQIIGSLMQGDQEFAEKHFQINWNTDAADPDALLLVPRKRRMQRVLESISVYPPHAAEPAMRIVMADAHGGSTEIIATQGQALVQHEAKQVCQTLAAFEDLECQLLHTVE